MEQPLQQRTVDTMQHSGQALIVGGVISAASTLGAMALLTAIWSAWFLAGVVLVASALLSIASGLRLRRVRPLRTELVQLNGLLASASGMFLGAAAAYLITFSGWGIGWGKAGYLTVLQAGGEGALCCGVIASMVMLPTLSRRLHASLHAATVLSVQSLVLGISLALLAGLYGLAPALVAAIEPQALEGVSLAAMGSGRAAALAVLSAVNLGVAAAVSRARQGMARILDSDLTAFIDAQERAMLLTYRDR